MPVQQRQRTLVVGRDRELDVLARVLDAGGPRVCFVYGMPGVGKTSLLQRFLEHCEALGVPALRVDCRTIDPTETGFLAGLAEAGGADRGAVGADGTGPPPTLGPFGSGDRSVLLVDTYEVFRVGDPWLRHELLPSLGPSVAVVVAGREPPMLEWAVERGRLGGVEVLPLGPLDDEAADRLIEAAGVCDTDTVAAIRKVARGHPLALRLALEAQVAAQELRVEDTVPRVVEALAGAFRDELDDRSRRLLDAAAVPRVVTRGVMEAMVGEEADEALDLLGRLPFVEPTRDGLRLHDAVHDALAARLRAVDPATFRQLRTAAWRHTRDENRRAGTSEVARSTADLIYLIDNPVLREAMFPTTAHAYSVEPCRPGDVEAVRELWHRHDPGAGADALDSWLARLPSSVRAIRDRGGTVVGCSVVATWRDIPPALERDDPVLGAFARHAAQRPLPAGQMTVVHRRWLAADTGERPSPVQAAAWLDVKGIYFRLRPHVGRLYSGGADPEPFLPALLTLGFQPLDPPVVLGDGLFHPAVLDFGPESLDGWLSRIAAQELGIETAPLLDPTDRTVDVGGARVGLSPLEYGLLECLASRSGKAVSRADIIEAVWGTTYAGGSNVVDVVVRSLRRKLGEGGPRIETVRGVGYRLS